MDELANTNKSVNEIIIVLNPFLIISIVFLTRNYTATKRAAIPAALLNHLIMIRLL